MSSEPSQASSHAEYGIQFVRTRSNVPRALWSKIYLDVFCSDDVLPKIIMPEQP